MAWNHTPDTDTPAAPDGVATGGGDGQAPPTAAKYFPDLESWVAQWFAPIIVRRADRDFRWCPRWWEHAEVISRLRCLWDIWEDSRAEGGAAMSNWWHEADYHLAVIAANGGPFGECSRDNGHRGVGAGLPSDPAPEGTWGAGAELS